MICGSPEYTAFTLKDQSCVIPQPNGNGLKEGPIGSAKSENKVHMVF